MEPGVVMATQNFKRYFLLNLYREGEKNLTLVGFLLPIKREIRNVRLAACFLHLETAGLPVYYPLTTRELGMLGQF